MADSSDCIICGKSFERVRASKTTCSDACRKKLSRNRKKERDAIVNLYNQAIDAINTLGDMLRSHEYDSYELVRRIELIEHSAYARDISSESSVWECRECGMIRKEKLPKFNDCYCDSSQWVLQKKLL